MLSSIRTGFLLARQTPRGGVQHIVSSLRQLSSTANDDTHDDFKPKYKGQAAVGVFDQIKNDIQSHRVFIYMKGVPEEPLCGFSNMACRILDAYGAKYGSRNVLADADLREGIKQFTKWPTIPQVFVDGEFVGGADILMSMHDKGELEKLLSDNASK